jgi:hypothetical protein
VKRRRVGSVVEDKWGGVYLLLKCCPSTSRVTDGDEWEAFVLLTQNDGRSAGMHVAGGIDMLSLEWIDKHTKELA